MRWPRSAALGGFATHACVDAALVMPLPPGFAFDDAAAFICTYGTTHHALLDRAALKAGETVLVLGAAGGVGTAAIQIAKAAGARVIAAASSDEKCALCSSSAPTRRSTMRSVEPARGAEGADRRQGPRRRLRPGRRRSGRAGVPLDRLARPLSGGRLRRGGIPALPLNLALLKGASLVGVFWGDFARREPKRNAKRWPSWRCGTRKAASSR